MLLVGSQDASQRENLRAGLESIGSAVVWGGKGMPGGGHGMERLEGRRPDSTPDSLCRFLSRAWVFFFSEEEDGPSAGSWGGLNSAAHVLGRMPAHQGGSSCHCRPPSGRPRVMRAHVHSLGGLEGGIARAASARQPPWEVGRAWCHPASSPAESFLPAGSGALGMGRAFPCGARALPSVRVCAFGLHRGSQHHAVHGHIHLPQGLCHRGTTGAAATASEKRSQAPRAQRRGSWAGPGQDGASHSPGQPS